MSLFIISQVLKLISKEFKYAVKEMVNSSTTRYHNANWVFVGRKTGISYRH
ncbi:hypothetical protein VAE151_560515 [Vibrio aestuarianus]|uniref:Uncharacterized protein n=1 Tax=Vibrio aestuarianus TaxID=28171 RepID=A0ABM9FS55_9VIBR|nr:hypothetical protein VAE308_1051160 [Vibrio aestuarianus]CAH8206703.1 hypothetical protein VAE055_380512 [Vibrio aestuarianus]CAH8206715.1 hypothetical protein VAE032_271155 [Vibrio aestuarianus]CAH8206883.1 hypothetical protein VAE128_461161 [Vibrio aestuarianus]CAH8207009.1 hypothetical protein VAE130_571159 [Vibrio aestuarianus]